MAARRDSQRSLLSQSGKGGSLPVGCLAVFLVPFPIAGLLVLFFGVVQPLREISAAQSWVETPCEILASRLKVNRDSEGVTYSVDITFAYEWEGERYTSDRYQFINYSSSNRRAHQAIVDAHPPGQRTVCYVNPENPAQVVLDRERAEGLWIGLLIGAVFTLGGGAALVGLLVYARRQAAAKRASSAGLSSRQDWLRTDATSDVSAVTPPAGRARQATGIPPSLAPSAAGRVTLKPAMTPLGQFGAALAFAVVWNGIVSFFVYHAVESIAQGSPEWCLIVFLIPFVAVGLAVLGFAAYSFLALFNPRPTVTLEPGHLRLGDRTRVGWTFSGSFGRIRHLKITLTGTESATYRRGTKTATDQHVFLAVPITDAHRGLDIVAGQAEVQVPADTMHSMDAANNKILWSIDVHGDVAFWPDVRQSFPIVLLPRQPASRRAPHP